MTDRERMEAKADDYLGLFASLNGMHGELVDLLLAVVHEEREGCEKECDQVAAEVVSEVPPNEWWKSGERIGAFHCKHAIRARSDT